MRTIVEAPTPVARKQIVADQRSAEKLLAPFDDLAARPPSVVAKPLVEFDSRGRKYTVPRYLWLGPKGGGDIIRIGSFATIHGDEPEGALARFLAALEKAPELAEGYALFIYPICNPAGFEDNTRHSHSGKDLNREFWAESPEPEVRALETEIWTHAFHGIITLHSDDTSHGLDGFVNGAVLSEHLLEPALQSAETSLPRNRRRTIDGFPARRGLIYSCYGGVLKSPAGLSQPPARLRWRPRRPHRCTCRSGRARPRCKPSSPSTVT